MVGWLCSSSQRGLLPIAPTPALPHRLDLPTSRGRRQVPSGLSGGVDGGGGIGHERAGARETCCDRGGLRQGSRPRRGGGAAGICVRQVKRLVRAYRADGDAGLVSRQRGWAWNRRLGPGVGERASELLGSKYRDFGPTLACEKLAELEGIFISRETIRRLQIQLGYGSRSGGVTSGRFNCASGGRGLAN